MGKTSIEWTDETWNPVVGCTRISPGCKNCYAFKLHDMRHEAYLNGSKVPEQYAKPFTEIQLKPERLATPLKRRKPSMWFVNSVSDLFHKDVPDEFIDRVFAVMALANRHTFQVLTKRPERAAAYLRDPRVAHVVTAYNGREFDRYRDNSRNGIPWPLPNVWIGTSIEDQKTADSRIPHLLKAQAEVRFLSCEPLLGSVDLSAYFPPMDFERWQNRGEGTPYPFRGPDWVIVGGESGDDARPMHPAWARSLRDQCEAADVAFHFKQWGEWTEADIRTPQDFMDMKNRNWTWLDKSDESGFTFGTEDRACMVRVGKKAAGRTLDGREWDEFPKSACALTGG